MKKTLTILVLILVFYVVPAKLAWEDIHMMHYSPKGKLYGRSTSDPGWYFFTFCPVFNLGPTIDYLSDGWEKEDSIPNNNDTFFK